MTGPVTTEALVEKLAQTMWEQSYGTLANASWAEAHRVAEAIPDGRAAWNIETVLRKASEITTLHIAPLLADLQQQATSISNLEESVNSLEADLQRVTASRRETERADAAEASLATATFELARLRAEGEAKDRRIALADRVKAQLEVALNALVKIDRGGKPMREIAAQALLDIAMAPYPQELPALARAATAREG